MPQNTIHVPKYRYFAVDLMSNEIIAEIPFRGVSWSRALKSAGTFTGKIPVIPQHEGLDLYNTTTPAVTALYVVRDDVCVWGGMIWSRSYDVETKNLTISASEFTSYLYHRRIWKTWGHEYGATVTIEDGEGVVEYDYGSDVLANPGSSVFLEFYEPKDFIHNGYYRVSGAPAPTLEGFSITNSVADISTVEVEGGIATVTTSSGHGFHTGDEITISCDYGAPAVPGYWEPQSIVWSPALRNRIGNPNTVSGGTSYTGSGMTGSYVGGKHRLTATTGGSYIYPTPVAGDGTGGRFTVVSGDQVAGRTEVTNPNAFDIYVRLYAGWYIASGAAAVPSSGLHSAITLVPAGATITMEFQGVVPTASSGGAITGLLPVLMYFSTPAQAVPVPGTLLDHTHWAFYSGATAPATTPVPFFSGATTDDPLERYSWEGTTDASISASETGVQPPDVWVSYSESYIDSTYGAPFDGTHEVTVPAGFNTNVFTFPVLGSDIARTSTSGTATRPLPDGTYTSVTVTLRTDTYDYVRDLLDAAFSDYSGSTFPNAYIEPGISYGINIVEKELSGGLAYITTEAPHGLSLGQSVTIQDIGPSYDGEFEVVALFSDTKFAYVHGGFEAPTAVAPVAAVVASVEAYQGVATITTSAAHNFLVGQHVQMDCGFDVDPSGLLFNGDYTITDIPTSTTFKYSVLSTEAVDSTPLPATTATVGGNTKDIASRKLTSNTVTITTELPHGFSPGNSVTISGLYVVEPLAQKSLNAISSVATIDTATAHPFASGDSVTVSGLDDNYPIVKKSIVGSTVTMVTDPTHNLSVGQSVTITDMVDSCRVVNKALTSNVATLTTDVAHNILVGNEIKVENIEAVTGVTAASLIDNVARLTVGTNHNFNTNDKIKVNNIPETQTVVSREILNGIVTLTFGVKHNFLEGQEITVSGIGAPYNGKYTTLSVTDTRVVYQITDAAANAKLVASGGTVTSPASVFNGEYTVATVTSTEIVFGRTGNNSSLTGLSGNVTRSSIFNGTYTVTAVPSSTTLQYAKVAANSPSTAVPIPTDKEKPPARVSTASKHLGARTVTAITRNTFSFAQGSLNAQALRAVSGQAVRSSIFNGTRAITSINSDKTEFTFALSGASNVLEQDSTKRSYATYAGLSGVYTIATVPDANTFTYAKTHTDIEEDLVYGAGSAVVYPLSVVNSYGPYPGNADIGIGYSTREYSGMNVDPVSYRGFELRILGDALDTYSDSIDGFEYRIDCSYDEENNKFNKTFVLIPINFPNPPPPGEASPVSRFGADKLVFEYPGGSIQTVTLDESAENSSTRFFAQGSTDLSADAGLPTAVASAEDLLNGSSGGRRWPLLDETEKLDDILDNTVLYAYARRYLAETRPPGVEIAVAVNGSISPFVGSYNPGDWCSLIIDDDFVRMRLASGLEPRDTVLVRKINGFVVSVPDGTTAPERVALSLVAEWEVDKRGE